MKYKVGDLLMVKHDCLARPWQRKIGLCIEVLKKSEETFDYTLLIGEDRICFYEHELEVIE